MANQFLSRFRIYHYYAHFRLPPAAADSPGVRAMLSVGADFGAFEQQFRDAMSLSASQRLRAEIRLWDMLLNVVNRSAQSGAAPMHPAIERVLQLVVARLSEPLSLIGIADEVGLSQGHLSRLFHQELGRPLSDYIRQCRLAKARHLIVNSDLSFKAIAAMVGIRDPQLFNKTVRKHMGKSPSQIRQEHTE